MSDPARLVIFDLDGTLVDSNRDLIPALNKATATEGLPPISIDDVGHVVGEGALRMIERAYHFHGRELEVGSPLHKHLLEEFLKHYEENVADKTVFYDGVLEALDALSDAGWKLAVCTNKYERFARKLLQELGQVHRFEVITGGDTFPIKKPDPAHLIETANRAGIAANRCIMVGDSINDIKPALAADIPVIAVDFGYSAVPVTELGPDRVISSFAELVAAVEELTPRLG